MISANILIFSLAGYLVADFLASREQQNKEKVSLTYHALKLISGLISAGIIVGIVMQLHVK